MLLKYGLTLAVQIEMMKKNGLTRARHTKADSLLWAGRNEEAEVVYAQICKLDPTDASAWVRRGLALRKMGRLDVAESCCRRALTLAPKNGLAYKVMGQVRQCQGRLNDAIAYYRQAVTCENDAQASYLLANALRESGALHEAAGHYREALRLQPDYVAALSNLGALMLMIDTPAAAAAVLNRALSLDPDSPQILCNLGHTLMREGRLDEALVRYQRALAYCPDSADAATAAASVLEKKGMLEEVRAIVNSWRDELPPGLKLVAAKLARRDRRIDDAIEILTSLLECGCDQEMRADAQMLLGQLYDKQGTPEKAYAHLCEGNRLAASIVRDCTDNGESYLQRVKAMRRYLIDELVARDDNATDEPIFLLGFPRSGTTLLEQILDSHPGLFGLEEKATVTPVVQAFESISDGSPEALARLTPAQVETLRKLYFEERAKYVLPGDHRQVVDKLPLNTVNVPLIWRLFPRARIILAIRHPCDACFSCFMQHFSINEAMASFFTLESTARVYDAVMATWLESARLLPLRYHRIRYEDLVDDFEGETRRLLDFLGVDWNDSVRNHVEHAAKRGTINTPSYHQVTQPIYREARYRWNRYAKYFEGIQPILQPYIDYFGY